MDNLKEFWLRSYRSDRLAFYLELVSFLTTLFSSLLLATTATNPDMRMVYPGFFIGSVCAAVAYFRRELAFPFMLTLYFSAVNIFGFLRSMEIL